jgi:hypothetical protein
MSATLSVYLRSYTPVSEPQDEVVAGARTLDERGTIDDVQFSEWPATARLSRDCEPVQIYDRITNWADEHDVQVDPPFRTHTRTNPVTGEAEDVLHTPVVSLVLFEDGEIAGVAPCTLPDGTHLTARTFIDDLRDDANPFEAADVDALTA